VDEPTPELSVDPASISATASDGSYSIAITCNVAWTATKDADWLTLNPASGEGNGRITVNVTENIDIERMATITIRADELSKTIPVTQQAIPAPPHAASSNIWVIGNQIWSDVIHLPECDKEDFGTITTEPQCRSFVYEGTPLYYYNSPFAVDNAAMLCPSPWRVATKDDFVALDIALGGTGENRAGENPEWIIESYVNTWGAGLGGVCDASGVWDVYIPLLNGYWTSTLEGGLAYGMAFAAQYTTINPQATDNRSLGFQIRCVK
jgi:hypothetical protein